MVYFISLLESSVSRPRCWISSHFCVLTRV